MNCPKCGGPAKYSLQYDACFCPACELWLEERCGDPGCGYCANRPPKPSDALAEEPCEEIDKN